MKSDKIVDPALNRLTEKVIGCAYTVSNTLGAGFLEKVYENALVHELRKNGLTVAQQASVPVWYDGVLVGDYTADLIVDSKLLVELKAVKALDSTHQAQCLNYLRATGIQLCLLINFGNPRVQVVRLVLYRLPFSRSGSPFYHLCPSVFISGSNRGYTGS